MMYKCKYTETRTKCCHQRFLLQYGLNYSQQCKNTLSRLGNYSQQCKNTLSKLGNYSQQYKTCKYWGMIFYFLKIIINKGISTILFFHPTLSQQCKNTKSKLGNYSQQYKLQCWNWATTVSNVKKTQYQHSLLSGELTVSHVNCNVKTGQLHISNIKIQCQKWASAVSNVNCNVETGQLQSAM